MDSPTIIALEGPDGSGKTRHARAIADGLERAGISASLVAHAQPRGTTPWARALDYAHQRAEWSEQWGAWGASVVIADRWWLSTQILGLVLDNDSLMSLAEAECRALGHPALTVVLTAPDAVLDARLAVRGTPTTDRDREIRRMYESHARVSGMPIVDTSGPVADVQGRIKSLAQSVAKRG